LEKLHADRPHRTVRVELLQCPPGLDVAVLARHRPVDEVEVHDVEPQRRAGRLEGGQRLLVAVVPVAQLGGDEDLLAGQAHRAQRGSHPLLVAVGRGRVDVAVAGLQRRLDVALRLLRRDLEDAVADLRDLHSAREGDEGNGHVGLSFSHSRTSGSPDAIAASSSMVTPSRVRSMLRPGAGGMSTMSGTAMVAAPAASADSTPGTESSIATHSRTSTPSMRAAVR